MKRLIIILPILLISVTTFGQKKIKNLNLFKTENFNPKASITVKSNNNDPALAGNHLKSALLMNGFKIISDKVAQQKLELKNDAQKSNTTFSQDATVTETTYFKSIYLITYEYRWRDDIGCGGIVISNLTGQIIDLANDGEIVATFNFSQGGFSGKCTDKIMQGLAHLLKTK